MFNSTFVMWKMCVLLSYCEFSTQHCSNYKGLTTSRIYDLLVIKDLCKGEDLSEKITFKQTKTYN